MYEEYFHGLNKLQVSVLMIAVVLFLCITSMPYTIWLAIKKVPVIYRKMFSNGGNWNRDKMAK